MKVWTKVVSMGILVMVVATGLLTACGKNPQESLRERATEWNTLTSSLPTGDKQQDLNRIESFLEPSAARAERAKEYYRNWTSNETGWRDVQSSVDEVSISSDGKFGTVRYTSVYEWQGEDEEILGAILGVKKGDRITKTQITNWKLIGKVWYRTMETAEVK